MLIDLEWASGLVFGIQHNDEAIIEYDDTNEVEFCNAILIHLGLFTVALLFPKT